MRKVLALTQGVDTPSTRFRWQQYVNDLLRAGLDASESVSQTTAYAPVSRVSRPMWLAKSISENFVRVLNANRYDLRFLQRNLTATLCTWEPLLRKPLIFDVDDAIFLGPRGGSANRIARTASLIICGNNFLADHFCRFGPVEILPTAIDTNRFVPRTGPSPAKGIIGWSGSSSGLRYLYSIEPAIKTLLDRYPNVGFKVVSDKAPTFKTLPCDRVYFEPWNPEREVEVLHEFTVGIMPLENDLWARGKCSFKMLTYMAAGLPVVVSPVGMNAEVLAQSPCGYAANTTDDWVDAISSLLSSPDLAAKMGRMGRQLIEAQYSRNVIAPRLGQLLKGQL